MSILDSFSLRGKVALVTGGARTLGYDMADTLADAGADLVITSRDLAHARGGRRAAAGGARRRRPAAGAGRPQA